MISRKTLIAQTPTQNQLSNLKTAQNSQQKKSNLLLLNSLKAPHNILEHDLSSTLDQIGILGHHEFLDNLFVDQEEISVGGDQSIVGRLELLCAVAVFADEEF